MKITREDSSQLQVSLNIELESDDIEPYLERSYKRVVNKVQIPGFRPGKAPRYIVQTFMGKEAMVRESLDLILQESLDKAIKEENLETMGEPDVELVEIEPLSFKAVVPLEPAVDLGSFRSLRLTPDPVEVTDEELDASIEGMRYDSAPWEPVERPVKFGDLLTLDVDGTIEGNSVVDVQGAEFLPAQDNEIPFPGFSIHLEGIGHGESKEFTLAVPEDYRDASIAGKEARFKVKVSEIKEKQLPELNDEFAKGVGDGHESVDALRASVLEQMTQQAESTTRRAFQEKVLLQVIEGASIEFSELTATREIDHLMEDRTRALEGSRIDMDTYLKSVGKTQEELREELRPVAQERLTRAIVLRTLAKDEDIDVTSEEIDAEVDSMVSGSANNSDELRRLFSSEDARSSIGNTLLTRKVLDRLAALVQAEDEEPAEVEDAAATEGPEPADESDETEGAAPATDEAGDEPHEEGAEPDDADQPE